MGKRIVVVGSSNTDMIVQVPRIPRQGETVLGGSFSTAAGGKGANQAVAAARAGGEVVFVARVGEDMLGEEAIRGFLKDGITVDHVRKTPDILSGVALIFVDARGENSIAVAPGANHKLTPDDILEAQDAISGADILLMQLETPTETVLAAAEVAHEKGIRTILNPAPARSLPDELFRYLYMITPNENEAETLSGVAVSDDRTANLAAKVLFDKGIEIVVVTMGDKGAVIATPKGYLLVPGFKVEAVDSTAAGDVFNGALAVSLAEGMSMPEAVRFANAAAALSVTRLGAQPSAPKRNEILEFLNTH